MREHTLQVNHLQIAFRTGGGLVRAVRDISFCLERGRTLAIVGESGSGKSVTSRAVMGLLAPNAVVERGEILYKGKNLLQMSEKELCKLRGDKIAMIFQDPLSALDPIMPIGKQIAETMVINGKMSKADAKNRAIQLMEEVGIRDAKNRFSRYPFEFSGGMRQRIVIAIDPVAIFGLLIAAVMLVCMVSGFVQYAVLQAQNRQMTDYVTALELENAQLSQEYHDGYDLDEIRTFAEENHMIPAEDASQIRVEVQIPQQQTQPVSLWESITTFLAGLFA